MSIAWAKAFVNVYDASEIAPLVVIIQGLGNAEPPEVSVIRNALDSALNADGKGLSCAQIANTIFPYSQWNAKEKRDLLYRRYSGIFGRIRKHHANRNGVYFQRLIAFGSDENTENGVNQLEHIITTWLRGNHRRSALQASVVDPHRDHTHQRQRGFPCLQQVAFAPIDNGGLSVTGFYAKQHMFERAYGNYLGLCRLGHFMARAMELTLSKVICIATPAARDRTKNELSKLAGQVRQAISDFENGKIS